MIQKLKNLKVNVKSYFLAMKVFGVIRTFPKEETFSLTSEIIRSSRSIAANLTEGWAKREYELIFQQRSIHSLESISKC